MNRYFEEMVLAASPEELTRLLYRKAIASTRNAREHLKGGRVRERCSAINNVYLVLCELISALRREAAPELAQRLAALYVYMQHRLLEANSNRDDAALAEVLGLLVTLSEPWELLASQAEPPKVWQGAPVSDGSVRIAFSA